MRLAKSLLILTVTCAFSPVVPHLIAQNSTATRGSTTAETLAGTWRLVSIETIRPGGGVIYPFYGRHPKGLLMYDRTGWMSVQIISDPGPTVPAASSREKFLQAPASEKSAAIDGFYAYYGTWTVDDAGTEVTHHIKQSLYPGERNTDATRRLTLEGNHLTLVAKTHEMGEDHERKLVWERIEAGQN